MVSPLMKPANSSQSLFFAISNIESLATQISPKLGSDHGDVSRSTSYGVYISQLIVLLEHLAMLLTSTLAINC